MNKNQEIEFKYDADKISLTKFKQFCESRHPTSFLEVSGFDHFYENTKDKVSFCRHRKGALTNQLTFKRKLSDTNNFVRTEHNLDLDLNVKEDTVTALCSEFGYEYNTSVFKTCFIYFYEFYSLVIYFCYDKEMKGLGKFFEIELKEGHDFGGENQALGELTLVEKLCKPLGISAQSRIKKSLYEMYKV